MNIDDLKTFLTSWGIDPVGALVAVVTALIGVGSWLVRRWYNKRQADTQPTQNVQSTQNVGGNGVNNTGTIGSVTVNVNPPQTESTLPSPEWTAQFADALVKHKEEQINKLHSINEKIQAESAQKDNEIAQLKKSLEELQRNAQTDPAAQTALHDAQQPSADPQASAEQIAAYFWQKAQDDKHRAVENAIEAAIWYQYIDPKKAIEILEQALSWSPDHLVVLDLLLELVQHYQPAKARDYAQKLHALCLAAHQAEPDNQQAARDYSVSLNKVANLLQHENPAQALTHYQNSLKICKMLHDKQPDNQQAARDYSVSLNKVADLLQHEKPAQALTHYQDSLDIRKDLHDKQPENQQAARDYSISLDKVANLLQHENPEQALTHYQDSLDIRKKLYTKQPENRTYRRDLAFDQIRWAFLKYFNDNDTQALLLALVEP